VVPVEMDLECLAVPIATVKQFLLDVWLAGRGHQSRHLVFGRKNPVDLSVRFDRAGPAHHCRHPIATFPTLFFSLRNGVVPPSGPENDSAPLSVV
jgi:hypothetical protein